MVLRSSLPDGMLRAVIECYIPSARDTRRSDIRIHEMMCRGLTWHEYFSRVTGQSTERSLRVSGL